jgi:hypothetical protein
MMEHTPGPWILDSAKDGDSRYQIIHGQLPKGINGDFGYPIADTMNRHHCIAPEEDADNGRILASAWDMLNTLERISDCVNDTNVAWETRLYQIKCYVKSGIDKARGE